MSQPKKRKAAFLIPWEIAAVEKGVEVAINSGAIESSTGLALLKQLQDCERIKLFYSKGNDPFARKERV